jgi:hypothetical protein
MTMLVLTHRLFEAVTAFRAGSWAASPQFGGGLPHSEVMGCTLGIIGYGRIGREVAERAAGLKCRVLAANRSPVAHTAPAETVFPLTELDRMLPLCDTVLISCGLAPDTKGLIDARRLALMKPGALLINVARAQSSMRMRSTPRSRMVTWAAPRSMSGGSIPPRPSRTAGRRDGSFTNCRMCSSRHTVRVAPGRPPTGAGAWWPPISTVSRAANRSRISCFRPDQMSCHL